MPKGRRAESFTKKKKKVEKDFGVHLRRDCCAQLLFYLEVPNSCSQVGFMVTEPSAPQNCEPMEMGIRLGNACWEVGEAASRRLNLLSCSAHHGISCFIFS